MDSYLCRGKSRLAVDGLPTRSGSSDRAPTGPMDIVGGGLMNELDVGVVAVAPTAVEMYSASA